uniref:Uncharacterized protein n=1 Tax=Hordeum vulgare subsp. vulgare TaxID=112509 RepID=A0A8I6XUF1_HORVV
MEQEVRFYKKLKGRAYGELVLSRINNTELTNMKGPPIALTCALHFLKVDTQPRPCLYMFPSTQHPAMIEARYPNS